jgi:hypothetical protein
MHERQTKSRNARKGFEEGLAEDAAPLQREKESVWKATERSRRLAVQRR